jgi:YHS domain-containing protein
MNDPWPTAFRAEVRDPRRAGVGWSNRRAAPELERVTDPKLVCMVNDQYMGREQIPVVVEGRTYFGCCPACKERLGTDASIRAAVDPVSGESVDKATAVLGRDATGKILYFASEATFGRYRSVR